MVAHFTGWNTGERDKRRLAFKTRQSVRVRSLAAGSERDPRLFYKSSSRELTKLQTLFAKENCSFTCFIIYEVKYKLLQNKCNWSRKVTQTAVRPVAAVGAERWKISYLVVPKWFLCVTQPYKFLEQTIQFAYIRTQIKSAKYSITAALVCW